MAKRAVYIDPIDALRRLVAREGSQKAAAQALGISDTMLSDLIRGHKPFSAAMLAKLGLRRVVVAADTSMV